ncbi:hypothetical protein THAOC_06510, partial [Thalassiosira oceanica]
MSGDDATRSIVFAPCTQQSGLGSGGANQFGVSHHQGSGAAESMMSTMMTEQRATMQASIQATSQAVDQANLASQAMFTQSNQASQAMFTQSNQANQAMFTQSNQANQATIAQFLGFMKDTQLAHQKHTLDIIKAMSRQKPGSTVVGMEIRDQKAFASAVAKETAEKVISAQSAGLESRPSQQRMYFFIPIRFLIARWRIGQIIRDSVDAGTHEKPFCLALSSTPSATLPVPRVGRGRGGRSSAMKPSSIPRPMLNSGSQ